MNTETILKQEQITQIVGDFGCGDDCDNQHETARAIEQAVLQSPEIQALRKDAERLDWLSDPENNIGNVQLPTVCVERNPHSLRDAIDDAMEQQK